MICLLINLYRHSKKYLFNFSCFLLLFKRLLKNILKEKNHNLY